MKKAPNTKHQVPVKAQAPNPNSPTWLRLLCRLQKHHTADCECWRFSLIGLWFRPAERNRIGGWDLELPGSLELGIWSFEAGLILWEKRGTGLLRRTAAARAV